MKRNIYRQGIPKGINATVANKVGFLDGLLHDAAIVYASTGPYVLVIMTDGSSWANIAELTRQIEALRLQ
jgi:beta-lactamase class A